MLRGSLQLESHKPYSPPTSLIQLQVLRKPTDTGISTSMFTETHWSTCKRFRALSRYFYLNLNLILSYSMVQSVSWEANWFAASQEIPRISRNLNVLYRTHKRPPPVSILGQPNPVHIPTSHLLEIHPNISHPSTPRSPLWSLSLRFPRQKT